MRATNLTELVWNDEIEGLLRMCGEEESFIGGMASDYERFCALSRSVHLLQGHPFLHHLSCFLREVLEIPLFLSIEDAEVIWRLGADRLLERSLSKEDWQTFAVRQQEKFTLPTPRSFDISRFFKGNHLLNTKATSWDAWRIELQALCQDAFEKGFSGMTLVLPKDFSFVSPDPYHVGLSLQKKKKENADDAFLLAQLMRFLSEKCLQRDQILLLRVECDPLQAVKLVSYTEDRVGLPSLIWNVTPLVDPEPLLRWNAVKHQNVVGCALCRRDYECDDQWNEALQGYAERYPIGRLQVIE